MARDTLAISTRMFWELLALGSYCRPGQDELKSSLPLHISSVQSGKAYIIFVSSILGMPSSMDVSSYEKAPMLEDTWHSAASTSAASEEGEITMPILKGDKRKKILSKPWPEYPIKWIRSPWMFFIDLLLIILIMIFATREPKSAHLDFAGDITGFVPKFPQQIVTFRAYPEFVSNHSSEDSLKEAREHWMDLLPRELPNLPLPWAIQLTCTSWSRICPSRR